LLCFCLPGLTSKGKITAEMAMMMGEFYDKQVTMDCPVGGSKAIVDSLVRGIEKHGGKGFFVSMTVLEEIVVEKNGRMRGIRLGKNKGFIKANQAVVFNLSIL
jgi:phytoene dehydrogenase-like protein